MTKYKVENLKTRKVYFYSDIEWHIWFVLTFLAGVGTGAFIMLMAFINLNAI